MNTIGQISEMFDIPISTLRYYDKEGLFPDMQRTSGIRNFSDKEVEALRVIECLKKSGMEIKDIKTFMEWCAMGSETYRQRKELFINQEKVVKAEIERLEKTLAMIKFKQWYYEQAINDGNEDCLMAMIPDHLPEDIQALYDTSHTSHSSQTEKV
jgi:DNA-binding transcriptional MerR regulator